MSSGLVSYVSLSPLSCNYWEMVDVTALILKEEKLQEVLGHFRENFERGLTAENLGN